MTKNGWWGDGKKLPKRKKKVHCLQNQFFRTFFWAYGSRANSPDFFLIHFPSLMDFKGKKQLPDCFADFHFDILLIVLMICQKNICHFFLGDWSWTKNWCKFWILEFWFWGFGFWSFDFGGLDLGVLILGVWILEFWFWGFGSWSFDVWSWSFDFGGTVCTHLMFQNMRLGEHLQTPRIKPQGEGLT